MKKGVIVFPMSFDWEDYKENEVNLGSKYGWHWEVNPQLGNMPWLRLLIKDSKFELPGLYQILEMIHVLLSDFTSQLSDHDECRIEFEVKTGHFNPKEGIGGVEADFGDVMIQARVSDDMS